MANLVADGAPVDIRGSAFGLFNLATGLATLLASLLWDKLGASSTFLAGAGFAIIAMIGLCLTGPMLLVTPRAPTPN